MFSFLLSIITTLSTVLLNIKASHMTVHVVTTIVTTKYHAMVGQLCCFIFIT